MPKYFNKLKKTVFLDHFWSIFPILEVQNIFPENPALSRTSSYGFLGPCQNLQKTNETIPRKRLDKQKDRGTDGRTDRLCFIGPLRLPPGIQQEN